MATPAIAMDGVWKKFRRGERHDSLRDFLPALTKKLFTRGPKGPEELGEGDFWVLKDVSFEVKAGQAVGIIGRNGAGKSTMLKLLSRILKPNRGQCRVTGRVGALIELAAGFHPDLTGRENVFLQGAIFGMSRREVEKSFDSIMDFSGVEAFVDTPVKRYSSGMNARLGFSIAAHLNPEVLLIDEVLAVGDLAFQQKCLDRLREFRTQGLAIAFVSHNMQAIASLCDRAVLLLPGSSPIQGSVEHVISEYLSGAAAHEDARVTLEYATLTDETTGQTVIAPVRPGRRLKIAFRAKTHVAMPRCAIQLWAHRSDGLSIFDGISATDGLDPVDVSAGSTIRGEVAFSAHLLRGVYTVGISLIDADRLWQSVHMPALTSFLIEEDNRWGGCVELAPRYALQCESLAMPTPIEDAV